MSILLAELASSLVSAGCTSWYDGCNTCTVMNGGALGCTKMMCFVQNEPKCLAYGADLQNLGMGDSTVNEGKVVHLTSAHQPSMLVQGMGSRRVEQADRVQIPSCAPQIRSVHAV